MKKDLEYKTNIKRMVVPAGAAVAMMMAVQTKDVWAEEFDTEEIKDQNEAAETLEQQKETTQETSTDPAIAESPEEMFLRTASASTEVVIGGLPEDFAAPLPISEVGLDYASLSENVVPTVTGDFTIHDTYQVSYDKGQTGHSTIAADGTITYRYEEAATLSDKSKADVVVTISDVVFTVGGQEGSELSGRMLVSQSGVRIRADVLDSTSGPYPWAYNVRMTYTVRIEGAGGAFVLPIQGLNQYRSGGSWDNLKNIDPELVHEKLTIQDGVSEYIYVIEDWKTGYEKEGDILKFYGKSNGAGDQNYNSGLVIIGDASGISFDLHEVAAVNTKGAGQPNTIYIRLGGLSHMIDSSTGKGGTIQTTLGSNSKSANASGLLNDDSVLDPGHYSIPDGKNVTYTMTPDSGYTLKTVTVDGQTVTPEEHTNADGSKYWTYTFEYNMDNHEINVEWQAEYKIVYDANGGTGTMEEQDFLEEDDSMMSKENEFTKNKRQFKGFYGYIKDPETGEETQIVDDSGQPVLFESAEDMKQYFDGKPGGTEIRMEAQWTYTVTYVDEWTGRTIQETITVDEKDSEPAEPADPTRDGYTFDHWEKEEDDEGNIVYKAQWKRTVIYDDAIDDSIYMPSTTLTNDEAEPAAPANPTKKGYTFAGWARNEDDKGNIRYTAQWERTVIYDDSIDDSIYMPSTTLTNDEAEPAAPANPTKKGYTFAGWSRSEDEEGNIRYTAQWKRTITYIDPETGTVYMPVTEFFNNDSEPTGPGNPTREGYTFAGWVRTMDAYGNIVYEAQWNPIPPKTGPTIEQKEAPAVRQVGVQTDVQSSMGLWSGLIVGSQAILVGLFGKKKDEE